MLFKTWMKNLIVLNFGHYHLGFVSDFDILVSDFLLQRKLLS